MAANTIRLHRVLTAPSERIYRAFLDADALVKWLPPHGFTGKVHQMDAKVGGSYRMSFTNFTTATANLLAARIWSWCRQSLFAIPTSSTTPICPEKW